MTSVTHSKVATLPDEDGKEVNKAEWNAEHLLAGLTVVVEHSAAAVTGAADTAENVLVTINLPALGPNDAIRVSTLWSLTSSANNKTPRIRLGGAAGTIYSGPTLTTSASVSLIILISNRGVANSQVGFALASNSGVGTANGAVVTSTLDTSTSQPLVISCQKALGSETMTLERYLVERIISG